MAKRVWIDDGHEKGNVNGGKLGFKEEQGNLKSARYLQEILKGLGIEVRVSNDYYDGSGLSQRGKQAANWNADVFFSIHSNAGGGKGTECYYSIDIPSDKKYAQMVADAISKEFGIANRGAKIKESKKHKGEDYMTVIDTAQDGGVPHVFLVESMFHDNLAEEKILLNDETHRKLAKIYAAMIVKLLGVNGSVDLPDRSDTTKTEEKSTSNIATIAQAKKYVGSRCKELQTKLNQAGYDCGKVDGDLGKNTYNALIKFQTENKLEVDGYAGKNTFAKLDEVIKSKQSVKVESDKSKIVKKLQKALNDLKIKGADGKVLSIDGDPGKNTRHAASQVVLRKVTKNSVVRVLQEILVKLGYKIAIDGSYGSKTEGAIKKYQKGMKLKIDGICGRNTWNSLLDRL